MKEYDAKPELTETEQHVAPDRYLRGNNVSDTVIIEIVHAIKDIIIEFIHRRYPGLEEQ